MDVIAFVDGHDYGICLPDRIRDAFVCRPYFICEHLLTDRIDLLVPELLADFYPPQILSNSRVHGIETISGGNGEDDCIAIDARAVSRGCLVDEPFHFCAGFAGF